MAGEPERTVEGLRDAKVRAAWWERERSWILALAAATIFTIGLNIYGILFGITVVLPHLFYLPIVIASYRFQKRGFIFSVILGFAYLGIVFILGPTDEPTLVSALSRFIVFIAIGAV
ncbi:MAG TPA: hypothetical protein VE134_03785, partial [Methanomicrobiales archaeon]|nr:hypothetical protein [Methanomicrobiales archaeon]